MMHVLVAAGLTVLLGGFALGYGTRAMISAYHREHARRRRLT
jgi:F0F1-type ATP synthase membrane subunit c/vacuolar-type H+-ATPase subunit K